MLARVLFVLLAGVPVCRGPKGASYSAYYDADEDVQNADFYESYNDEIKSPQNLITVVEPVTRFKKRELDDIRTLNPEEIIDVKGLINNILQGKKPGSFRGRRTAPESPESYDYLENSVDGEPEFNTDKGPVIKNNQPTVEVQKWSPTVDEEEYFDESSSEATEQHWSFVNQPETSTYDKNDIIAEVRKMITLRDGEEPRRSSIVQWRPTQEIQTWRTTEKTEEAEDTEETEETEDTLMYPLESTMYNNSDMQAEVRKLVQHWNASSTVNMQKSTTTFSNSDMQAAVRKLVQHWSSSNNVNMQKSTTTFSNSDMQAAVRKLVQHWNASNNVNMQKSTTTFSNSDMQAEVRKLVQHWNSSNNVNETTSYNNAAMRADVKKLIQHWSPHENVQNQSPSGNVQHQGPSMAKETTSYNNSAMRADVRQLIQHWSPHENVQHQSPSSNVQHLSRTSTVQHQGPSMAKGEMNQQNTGMQTEVSKLKPWSPILDHKHWSASGNVQHQNTTINVQHWSPSDNVQDRNTSVNVQHESPIDLPQRNTFATDNQETLSFTDSDTDSTTELMSQYPEEAKIDTHGQEKNISSFTDSETDSTTELMSQHPDQEEAEIDSNGETTKMWSVTGSETDATTELMIQHSEPEEADIDTNGETTKTRSVTGSETERTTELMIQHSEPEEADVDTNGETTKIRSVTGSETDATTELTIQHSELEEANIDTNGETTKIGVGPLRAVVTTKETTAKTTQKMDINVIMDIISNLTYDYEWNLTEQFNKSIIEHGVPTCGWEKFGPGGAWTAQTHDSRIYDFENTSVVSKCFVCGLRTPEIPRNAHCADAFAGDFLPLMPIDAQSRGKIAGFRKYCRYIDTQNYVENPDDPRAIYGRFTGGCAVRWTDITGVFTQRTCRSKFRPLMGKHLASKRMAKLELALVNVENGCIISPMATLLPVSRGISLYARFHTCVCNTNWCNRATLAQASFNIHVTIVLAYWLVHYP